MFCDISREPPSGSTRARGIRARRPGVKLTDGTSEHVVLQGEPRGETTRGGESYSETTRGGLQSETTHDSPHSETTRGGESQSETMQGGDSHGETTQGGESPVARCAPKKEWAIGIYTGDSPLRLAPADGLHNPVITHRDVTDVPALFVADPFMVRRGGSWFMFFEVLNAETGRGQIGLAESADGRAWRYRRIVLSEPFHLSYPHVFEFDGEHYMIPETLEPGRVALYRARHFPEDWERAATLLDGVRCADPTVFRHAGRWWMYACTAPGEHDTLSLYHADKLNGSWSEHARSPVVAGDARRARPAGRVVSHGNRLIRFAQDCSPIYGTQVRAFALSSLTAEDYREEELPESPVLRPVAGGRAWNDCRMHHIDAHPLGDGRWIACVDGDAKI